MNKLKYFSDIAYSHIKNILDEKGILLTTVSIFFIGMALLLCGLSTAAGSVIAAAALSYNAYCYKSNYNEKRSEFYLVQIQRYFKDASDLISNGGNNNVKWHQAVNSLKTAIDLSEKLTSPSHQHVYFTDYIRTAYMIITVISGIDNFGFFYGIDYEGKSPDEVSFDSFYDNNFKKRISPDSLSYLCRFIDKASKANCDLNEKGSSWDVCFHSEYFKKPMTDQYGNIGLLANVDIIIKYIGECRRFDSQENYSTI